MNHPISGWEVVFAIVWTLFMMHASDKKGITWGVASIIASFVWFVVFAVNGSMTMAVAIPVFVWFLKVLAYSIEGPT